MQDPYRVLGVSPQAPEDDIKKAYRAMAKKYHPDVNNGSAEAEARMKEINEAYSLIMKMRREGTSGAGYGGYGSARSGYGGYGYQSAGSNPQMQAARNYILARHFEEAMHVLENISDRTAEWHYLCGEASLGLGNRVAALNYARQAVAMAPDNFEYRALLSRLEGSAGFYQSNGMGQGFTMPISPLACCSMCSLLSCLCGGGGLPLFCCI